MLKLENITKIYEGKNFKQIALNDVTLAFRNNEFVSILGPSGSGKTTLLNIIGGLDKYTYGNLIIDGVSTRKYKERDWNNYRSNKVGFIFQSYNLINHQTVLSNVLLSLNIAGKPKKESIKLAKKVLKDVGLENYIKKKPKELSGGQMQRVAIARALVTNPDIILCDEPTGALDSQTSIQIMELLKEISKEKLVIMVTHNVTLANKYSDRVIALNDGVITYDTSPYEVENYTLKKIKNKRKTMNKFTSLSLSFNNLLTKKSRTLLTSFAGSIGIIGIALVLSLSKGTQKYINKIEKETFSKYRVEFLHGKMKPKEKDDIMLRFKKGEIDILISTTVIEVGVDVPNANIMVIENSERFGLAQLHQLRGRVGRGEYKSYCILKFEGKGKVVQERMKIMCQTNDGFVISEKDLELRGSGDFFGTAQHGIPEMKIANLFEDIDVLKTVQDLSKKIMDYDSSLEKNENERLKHLIENRIDGRIEI